MVCCIGIPCFSVLWARLFSHICAMLPSVTVFEGVINVLLQLNQLCIPHLTKKQGKVVIFNNMLLCSVLLSCSK